jgi:hypothetical protein
MIEGIQVLTPKNQDQKISDPEKQKKTKDATNNVIQ